MRSRLVAPRVFGVRTGSRYTMTPRVGAGAFTMHNVTDFALGVNPRLKNFSPIQLVQPMLGLPQMYAVAEARSSMECMDPCRPVRDVTALEELLTGALVWRPTASIIPAQGNA